MKVLLVHNFYGSSAPSGENVVFQAERRLLEEHGHDIELFVRHSDHIRSTNKVIAAVGTIHGGLVTPWNPVSARALERQVIRFRPDIVHAHNTFPLIAPSIFRKIHKHVATVLTLHNYRLQCAAGIPMRDGQVCTMCLERRASWPAVLHGCYRGSRLATAPIAAKIALHRMIGTWLTDVDAFIALSAFQKAQMSEGGLPSGKVFVKPNFFPDGPKVVPWEDRKNRAVCVGRISAEKGVAELVTAWLKWGDRAPELVLVGDGPQRQQLEALVNKAGAPNVKFVGQVDEQEAQKWIAESKLLLLPSRWFEGFPMSLREAFAFGTPALVSDLGPLPEIVGGGNAGLIVRAGDSDGLLAAVSTVWPDEERLRRLSAAARREYELKYTADTNYEILMKIYESAISIRRQSLSRERAAI